MRILLLSLTCLILGCERKPSVVVNTPARDIAMAFSDGTLHEIEDKEALFTVLDDWIERMFVVGGYDHRLKECQKNWKVFDDRGHLIFAGSVAKSDTDVYLFVWVVKKNEGSLDTVFLQIGDSIEKGTVYPKHLLPYRKNG